jgi:hypothetical protein
MKRHFSVPEEGSEYSLVVALRKETIPFKKENQNKINKTIKIQM